MAIPRPRSGLRWLRVQPTTYAILVALFASTIGIAGAANYWLQGRRGLALVVGGATVLIVTFSLIQNFVALAAARNKESIHELEGCLYTLHAVLAPEEGCKFRLAIHLPLPTEDVFEQVTEYIGDKPKAGRIGRRFPINAGIIGKAYREKDVFVGRRVNDDYPAYVAELVSDWNYTEERAQKLNPGVKEWMGVPIYDANRDRVEAVLFLDATHRDFFTEQRQELVLAAVRGIAVFIGKRYS